MNTNRLLVHPVRARIINALAGRRLTRYQLAEFIPDTPPPSLYRNLRILVDAGIVETVERIPRRGVEEHVYALSKDGGMVSHEEASTWTPAQWQRALDIFLEQVSINYRSYLAGGGDKPCPANSTIIHLSPEEQDAFYREIGALFERYRDLPVQEGRERFIMSFVFQPDERSKR